LTWPKNLKTLTSAVPKILAVTYTVSVNILEMVQVGDVVTTDHLYEMIYGY